MRILILGAGGVGAYFGARLIRSGADVTFLVRPRRAAALRAGGLRISSPLGDFACHAEVLSEGTTCFDLVLMACKAYDLASAIMSIEPHIGHDTLVIPLLNGVAHLETLDGAFGRSRTGGGVAHLSVSSQPDGSIVHCNDFHRLIVGYRTPAANGILGELAERLRMVGVDCLISSRIEQDLWEKLVFLATLAGATSVLRMSIGELLETRSGPGLIDSLLAECAAVAGAAGFRPDRERLAAYRSQLLTRGSPLKSSMLRDIERGRRTESDHILGDLVRRGMQLGVSTPLLALCHSRLEAWDSGH